MSALWVLQLPPATLPTLERDSRELLCLQTQDGWMDLDKTIIFLVYVMKAFAFFFKA